MAISPVPFRIITSAAILSMLGICRADTSVLREMAKNHTSIFVLYSGDHAKPFAERLVREIKDFRDYNDDGKKKRTVAVSPSEAEQAINSVKQWQKQTTIAVISHDDNLQINSTIANAFRTPAPPDDFRSTLRIHTIEPKAGSQVFSIVVEAPDEERLGRVFGTLMSTRGKDYKNLDFENQWQSNKVVVRSNLTASRAWGTVAGSWNYVDNAKIEDKLALAEKAPEEDLAFLIDRSQPAAVPEVVRNVVMKEQIKPGTILATRTTLPNGQRLAVLTAPNAVTLDMLVRTYTNVNSVPSVSFRRDLPDLRYLIKDPSLIKVNLDLTGEDDRRIANALKEYMGKNMREQQIPVVDRGAAMGQLLEEISLQDLTGNSSRRNRIKTSGARYLWFLSVTNVSRRTSFDGNTRRQTPERPFNRSRPSEPTRYKNEKDRDFNERFRQYREQLASYEDERENWENREPISWHQSVDRVQESALEIQLKLFDLYKASDFVVWETQVTGIGKSTSTFQERDVVLNGNLRRPDALTAPAAQLTCELSVVLDGSRDASVKALTGLVQSAWVSGDPAVIFWDPKEFSDKGGANSGGGSATTGKVTSLTPTAIMIDLGELAGLKPGSIVSVEVNGKSYAFRVATVGTTSKCIPMNPAAKAILARIKKGMTVTFDAGASDR